MTDWLRLAQSAAHRAGRLLLVTATIAALLSALLVSAALAQGGTTRKLKIGDTVTGTLDPKTFAQVYTFDASTGNVVTIVATSKAQGLTLALLLTNAAGETLNQVADLTKPEAAIRNFALPASGAYYITVVRGNGAGGQEQGQFELALTGGQAILDLKDGLSVALTWNSADDLDLEVRNPTGDAVFFRNPNGASGGRLSANVNNGCQNTIAENPTETVAWPGGNIAAGSYEVIAYYNKACTQPAVAANFALVITVNGKAQDPIRGTLNAGQQFVASFVLAAPEQVTIRPGTVDPNVVNLVSLNPFVSKIQSPVALGTRTSVDGFLDHTNPADVYSFNGTRNQPLTVELIARSGGSLDTLLVLFGPNGNIVEVNDDATSDTRNSRIAIRLLPETGRYVVVVTRFGLVFGGTEGSYTLALGGQRLASVPTLTLAPTAAPPTPTSPANPGLPQGNIEIALRWGNRSDVRLLVRDPQGRSLFADVTSIADGGTLARQDNLACKNTTTSPQTYVFWPVGRVPTGTYEVQVWLENLCNEISASDYTLKITVNGKEIHTQTDRPAKDHYVVSFTVNSAGEGTVGAGGVFVKSFTADIGDISTQLAGAASLTAGRPVNGTIDSNAPFVIYTLDAKARDRIRVSMRATRPNLDPFMFLLDSNGAQLAENDDVDATNRNSRIDQTIPVDGTYVVVASRYGAKFGGTSGTFEISLTVLNR